MREGEGRGLHAQVFVQAGHARGQFGLREGLDDLAVLHHHQAEALAAKLRAEENIKAARKALKNDGGADVLSLLVNDDDTEAPTRRRYVVNDLTYEKAG